MEKIKIPSWVKLPKYCGVMVSKINDGINCLFITKEHNYGIINFIMN